jgi:hypothetical protein
LRRASWRFHPSALHKALPLVREHWFSASSGPPRGAFTLKDTGWAQTATRPGSCHKLIRYFSCRFLNAPTPPSRTCSARSRIVGSSMAPE